MFHLIHHSFLVSFGWEFLLIQVFFFEKGTSFMLTINKGRHILHSRQMQSASDISHTDLVISFFYISNYLSSMPFVSHTVVEFSHLLSIVFNVNSTDVTFVRM